MAFIVADRVKETSTTTGIGALTLDGALIGFRAFSAVCAVGDTLYYALQAVDAGGSLTGEWECGLGTYSAANTLTRTTVTSSSNSGAAVALAAGTKQVYITMPAVQVKWSREKLTANRTYYVATTGSDSNDGLTVGTPFLTIQKAVNTISSDLDTQGYVCTVQVADGTYTAGVVLKNCVGYSMPGNLVIKGNVAIPTNVIISTTSTDAFNADGLYSAWDINDLKIQTATSGFCLVATRGAQIRFGNLNFGPAASNHILAGDGGVIRCLSNYAISGASSYHMRATNGGIVRAQGVTVTITGTPNFALAFAGCPEPVGVLLLNSNTYTGSATGKRYLSELNSGISVGGAGATYLPGDIAGTTATGGQYA